jgi:hypothetical protein
MARPMHGLPTVGDLRRRLLEYPDDAPLFFAAGELCSGGYPEWGAFRVKPDFRYDAADNEVPTGTVIIEVSCERSDD